MTDELTTSADLYREYSRAQTDAEDLFRQAARKSEYAGRMYLSAELAELSERVQADPA
jgi:hypothetical protein